jgi:transcription factor E
MNKKGGRIRMQKSRTTSKAKAVRKAKAIARKPAVKKHVMSPRAKKMALEARRELRIKTQKKVLKEQAKQAAIDLEIEKVRIEGLLENTAFSEFISKNVGKKAISIIKMLTSPQTDDKLAADLAVKINEVRRILNVLDSYGVARYDTNKDSKGWLTFKWYLDGEKLTELHQTVLTAKPEDGFKLPENCNDFFFCGKCYDEQKIILPFDAAFEGQFKCDNCGKQLKQMSKDEATALFKESMETQEKGMQATG